MKRNPPKIENAPGHVWKALVRDRWMLKWQARTDLKRRGYLPKDVRLWIGTEAELTPIVATWIQDRCRELQSEMVTWGRGGVPVMTTFDGSIRSLIHHYRNDEDSPYKKTRFKTRETYDHLLKRLEEDLGDSKIAELKARGVNRQYELWCAPKNPEDPPKLAMGHSCITLLRILANFGSTFMEDDECARLSAVLHGMKFSQSKPRTEVLTADQVIAIRQEAHRRGRPSIALAQALQFELILRQKDVIGEWVPISEPGMSTVTAGNSKWLRGLRWEEIDANLILRHTTSKRLKDIEVKLRNAPMVMEELAKLGEMPTSGPIIVSEHTSIPYTAAAFRMAWRVIANDLGISKSIRNMDSRAGAITEALLAGAPPDSVRKSATHATLPMTMRYSRGDAEASSEVAQIRSASRNKTGTSER